MKAKIVKRQSWDKAVDVFAFDDNDIDLCIQKEGSKTVIAEVVAKSMTREFNLVDAINEGYQTSLNETARIGIIETGEFKGHINIDILDNIDRYNPFESFKHYSPTMIVYDEKNNKVLVGVAKYQLREGYTLEAVQKEAESAFKHGVGYDSSHAFERID